MAGARIAVMVRILALTAVTVAIGGCGGEAEEPSAEATSTAPATRETAGEPPTRGDVTIKGFAYVPARVTVRRGGEVTWSNEDASNHTVTFGGAKRPDDIGNLRAARKATVTFPGRGSFTYVCDFHPGMAGTVEVR